MPVTLVDTNVILDVLTSDPEWSSWSASELDKAANAGPLAINPIIYAEVSIGFERIEEVELALPTRWFRRIPIPWEAGFLAGKAFIQYRRRGGLKRAPLPDFFIGAHATVSSLTLLTRDAARYRTYFPKTNIIAP